MILEFLFNARRAVVQAPSFLFHYLFSWMFPTAFLRDKAACTPFPAVRQLLLRRSGIVLGTDVRVHLGNVIVGICRNPPALTLKDRAAIGPNVLFVTSSYPDDSLLMQHPEIENLIVKQGPIVVEEDAWIGAGVVILPNITIGRGAIVGAGSVVTKDVPPRTIVAGVPAKPLRTLCETADKE